MTSPEILKAVEILQNQGLVAFPTETVYGLGADADSDKAVEKVFRAKNRPFNHPLIVHLAHKRQLIHWASAISPLALKLADIFWPGPLTLVLKKQPHVLDSVTAGQNTIGLRIPQHPIAQALLQAFGRGIAAPSANQFTHVSPTTANDVRDELGNAVDLILDGGDCEVGLESTIVDMTQDQPVILRPGMITKAQIQAVLGLPVLSRSQEVSAIRTPGMHHIHYAPVTATQLIEHADISGFIEKLKPEQGAIVILFRSEIPITHPQVTLIQMPNEAASYAHDIYHTLRQLDKGNFKQIIIETVPGNGEWEAIRDRLIKASNTG